MKKGIDHRTSDLVREGILFNLIGKLPSIDFRLINFCLTRWHFRIPTTILTIAQYCLLWLIHGGHDNTVKPDHIGNSPADDRITVKQQCISNIS